MFNLNDEIERGRWGITYMRLSNQMEPENKAELHR